MTEKEANDWVAAMKSVCCRSGVEVRGVEFDYRENKITIVAVMPQPTIDFIPMTFIVSGDKQDDRHA